MPRPFFTPGKDLVPIAQEAGWAPGPVWTGAEISPPPGFDPQTVQPIASHNTVYATRHTGCNVDCEITAFLARLLNATVQTDKFGGSSWFANSCPVHLSAFCPQLPLSDLYVTEFSAEGYISGCGKSLVLLPARNCDLLNFTKPAFRRSWVQRIHSTLTNCLLILYHPPIYS
jgi:hypothetical protein